MAWQITSIETVNTEDDNERTWRNRVVAGPPPTPADKPTVIRFGNTEVPEGDPYEIVLDFGRKANEEAIVDLYKEHAKEGLNQYRYFGVVRSLVTWAPTIAVLAAIRELSGQVVIAGQPIDLRLGAGLVAVVVFLLQWRIQYFQARSAEAASVAQQKVAGDSLGEEIEHPEAAENLTYGKLIKSEEVRNAIKKYPDSASWALLAFFACIAAVLIFSETKAGGPETIYCLPEDSPGDRLACIQAVGEGAGPFLACEQMKDADGKPLAGQFQCPGGG